MIHLLAAALAQPLPVGGSTTGNIAGEPLTWTFTASEPGMLSVALRDEGDLDLVIDVLDEDGQPVVEGHADVDVDGDRGAEQIIVALPWPGTWRVRVDELNEGEGPFEIGASFFPMRAVARTEPPHVRPGRARHLRDSEGALGLVDASVGAAWQWYAVTPSRGGALTVEVRAAHGDLVLEAYRPGSFDAPWEESDQDLEGVLGNERLVLDVEAGQTVYYRVRDRDPGSRVEFHVQADLTPR